MRSKYEISVIGQGTYWYWVCRKAFGPFRYQHQFEGPFRSMYDATVNARANWGLHIPIKIISKD